MAVILLLHILPFWKHPLQALFRKHVNKFLRTIIHQNPEIFKCIKNYSSEILTGEKFSLDRWKGEESELCPPFSSKLSIFWFFNQTRLDYCHAKFQGYFFDSFEETEGILIENMNFSSCDE